MRSSPGPAGGGGGGGGGLSSRSTSTRSARDCLEPHSTRLLIFLLQLALKRQQESRTFQVLLRVCMSLKVKELENAS